MIMILTDKCKDDFLKSHYKESLLKDFDLETVCFIFNVLPLNHQYSDIIEWFDSVGIYISTRATNNEFMSYITNNEFSFYEKTRQEATTEAIKKANEIYNEIKA